MTDTPLLRAALRAALVEALERHGLDFWYETGNEDARDGFKEMTFDYGALAEFILATEPMQAIAHVVHEAVEQVDEWHGDEVHDGYCERPLCVAVLRSRGNDLEALPDD